MLLVSWSYQCGNPTGFSNIERKKKFKLMAIMARQNFIMFDELDLELIFV